MQRQLARLDRLLSEEMARLLALLPAEMAATGPAALNGPIEASGEWTPFTVGSGLEGAVWGLSEAGGWAVAEDQARLAAWEDLFTAAAPVDGRLTGSQAKHVMMQSKLPNAVLAKVWCLADCDGDGMLSQQEFCLAMYLIDYKLAGQDLPSSLPSHLVPPGLNSPEIKQ